MMLLLIIISLCGCTAIRHDETIKKIISENALSNNEYAEMKTAFFDALEEIGYTYEFRREIKHSEEYFVYGSDAAWLCRLFRAQDLKYYEIEAEYAVDGTMNGYLLALPSGEIGATVMMPLYFNRDDNCFLVIAQSYDPNRQTSDDELITAEEGEIIDVFQR